MATYYINADTGDDVGGTGTSGDPWETLAHAFDNTIADDTIVCQDSTATYDFENDTYDHAITIEGQQDDASGAIFLLNANLRWTFTDDVSISNITFLSTGVVANNVIFYYNTAATTCSFTNCIFDMIIDNTANPGAVFSQAAANTLSITNCLIRNLVSIGANTARLVAMTANSTAVITNSVFAAFSATLDYFFRADSNDVTIKNTIVYDGTGTSIDFSDLWAPATSEISYSCVYGTSNNPAFDAGTITSDPLFVDEDNDDFRLRPTSPCIGTGTLV